MLGLEVNKVYRYKQERGVFQYRWLNMGKIIIRESDISNIFLIIFMDNKFQYKTVTRATFLSKYYKDIIVNDSTTTT